MTKNNYELDVLINGKPVKEYTKDSRLYIEGRKGTDFSLRIRNNSSKRILAIPSVDGLSVMNGKTASFDSSGYIINGYDSLVIDGWRTSDKEVARFYFSDSEDSYATKMDRDGNGGVIGMAVFGEKENEYEKALRAIDDYNKKNVPQVIEKHIYHHDHCHCWQCHPWGWYSTTTGGISLNTGSAGTSGGIVSSANSTDGSNVYNLSATASMVNTLTAHATDSRNSASVKSFKQELGTGWGESKRSEVQSVEFERKDSPESVFEIFYNTREQLELQGIDFNAKPIYVAPQAFPGVYCEVPRK